MRAWSAIAALGLLAACSGGGSDGAASRLTSSLTGISTVSAAWPWTDQATWVSPSQGGMLAVPAVLSDRIAVAQNQAITLLGLADGSVVGSMAVPPFGSTNTSLRDVAPMGDHSLVLVSPEDGLVYQQSLGQPAELWLTLAGEGLTPRAVAAGEQHLWLVITTAGDAPFLRRYALVNGKPVGPPVDIALPGPSPSAIAEVGGRVAVIWPDQLTLYRLDGSVLASAAFPLPSNLTDVERVTDQRFLVVDHGRGQLLLGEVDRAGALRWIDARLLPHALRVDCDGGMGCLIVARAAPTNDLIRFDRAP